MRYTDYDEAEALHRQLWRIDVVLFNFEQDEDGNDVCMDGEYCLMGGGCHPFECFFDDRDETIKYIDGFTQEMALEALRDNKNDHHFDHVAVEVNELEGMDPGLVIASHEWLLGHYFQYWHNEECSYGRMEYVRAD